MNLQRCKMAPLSRFARTHTVPVAPAEPHFIKRNFRLKRGSRRGMGRRGWARFFTPEQTLQTEPVKAVVKWHEQPQNTIRARAAKVGRAIKSFFGRMIGR